MGWKRISRHRVLQKRVSLLRTKSRDKVGTASVGDQLLTDQGELTISIGQYPIFIASRQRTFPLEGWLR